MQKTQNTNELALGEGVLELPILGEPGNRIMPLKEPGIQFPRTRITLLRGSQIKYKTETGSSGREG